ncbi:transcription factor bHLH [Quillaja saponaria]|uniref:Transcription factor bHLH n=1 Tax=Quillaja saponaria TaxID=32244 RepID=A0AAD7KZ24_QUISA|nr:transcription factor bHLH [Quillaja saponaria]KAJ7948560.1 transcription factor bHLH [Quillaja saponaria]
MGRKKDSFWQHAEDLNGRFKCNYCGREFAGGATRIKSHLSGLKGNEIDICASVPEDVRAIAFEVIGGSIRRDKAIVGSSNIEGCLNSASAQGMQKLDEIISFDSLDENVRILREKLKALTHREADIQRELEKLESLPGKRRKNIEVDTWLTDAKQRKEQVFSMETELKNLTQEVTKVAERKLPESLTLEDADESGEEDLLGTIKLLRAIRALENLSEKKSKFLRECFLYCALYPANKEFEREDLIRKFADEGLLDGEKSLEGQFEEGLNILYQLQKHGMLEVGSNHRGGNQALMHEFSRATAMNIIEGKRRFMIRVNMGLKRMPEIQYSEHVEIMEKVSFVNNEIEEISLTKSPNCLKLSTLLLGWNPLRKINDSFFHHMPAIQVLDLSNTQLEILPDAVSDLKTLTALLLSHCNYLKYVPSLAKLQALKRLDLSYTAITELPQGLDMLLTLRWLDLLGLHELKILPGSVIFRLINLQYLALPWYSALAKVKADDVKDLKKLETFTCNFYDLREFNDYKRSMQAENRGLRSHIFGLGLSEVPEEFEMELEKDNKVVVIGKLKPEIPLRLHVQEENAAMTPVLPSHGIQDLDIKGCNNINNIQNMLSPANYGLNSSSELLSTSSPPTQNHQLHFTNNAPFQNASDSANIKDVESRFDVESVNISEVRELSGGGVKTSRNEAVAASKRPRNETMCEVLSSTRTTTSSSLRLFNVLHFDEIYDQEVSSILCKENVATRPVLPPHGIQDLDIEGGNNIQNMLTPTNYGLNCSSELLSTSSPPKQNHQLHFTNNAPFQNVSESAPIKDVRSSFDVQSVHISEVRELSGGGVKKSGNEAAAASKRPRNETPSPFSAFKVRKVKLGDRITALQKLVSPFGKTRTDSVLVEAIEYIRFLHEQVTVLSIPYMKNNGAPIQHQQDSSKCKISDQGPKPDLRNRGLCLVPVSSTFPVAEGV